MRTWNLPERLYRAIEHSHLVDFSVTTEPGKIFERCVALSGPVADLFLRDPPHRRFAETALCAERSLGMDKMAFGQVLGTVGSMLPETEAIFETNLLTEQHPELILEQAREALMLRSLHALREINTLRAVAEISSSRALELEEETRRDAMTGVYNRAYLDQVLAREFEHSTAPQMAALSVAFADLDNFKSINDKFGHQAGDRILQATARILRSNTRETDLIARYGGEEFVVVLPATDADTARSICERIVMAFQNTGHVIGSDNAHVTVSDRLRHARQPDLLRQCRRIRQGRRSGALHREASRPQPHRALRPAAPQRARECGAEIAPPPAPEAARRVGSGRYPTASELSLVPPALSLP